MTHQKKLQLLQRPLPRYWIRLQQLQPLPLLQRPCQMQLLRLRPPRLPTRRPQDHEQLHEEPQSVHY